MWILQSFEEELHAVNKIHLDWVKLLPEFWLFAFLAVLADKTKSFRTKHFLDLWALPKCFTAQILLFPASNFCNVDGS